MKREVRRIAVVVLVAIGAAALTSGSIGALPSSSSHAPPRVTLDIVVNGDLRSAQGQVQALQCFNRPEPDPFQAPSSFLIHIDLERVVSPACMTTAHVDWRIVAAPRSARDAPEPLVLRLRYNQKDRYPFTLDCHPGSPDVQCVVREISATRVTVDLRGK